LTISKRQLKTGIVYQVRYRDPSGKQRSRHFATRREAAAFESAEFTQITRGEWTDPRLKETKFGNWARRWLEADPGKRGSTHARDEIVVRLHLLPVFEHMAISHITPMDVQTAVNRWSSTAAPQTVHRQYRTLAAIFRSALNCDLIVKTPCRAIKLPKITRKQAHLIEGDQLAELALEMGEFGPMAMIGAMLGLRWGEVAGLRVMDLDLLSRKLNVVQQVGRDKSGRSIISAPKTNSATRSLTMPLELVEVMAAHLIAAGLTGADREALLFTNEVGGPLSYTNWRRRVWVPACEQTGLVGLGFHDLRRVNATVMVAAGVDIKTAQRRLGHADPRMTLMIYAQGTADGDETAAAELGKAFLPKNVHRLCTPPEELAGCECESPALTSGFNGGRNRTRTCDLCRVKAAR
jgi:integrase